MVLSVSSTRQLVDRFLTEYKGNFDLDFIVAERQEDVYGMANSRQAIRSAIEAAYHPARHLFVIVASNLENEQAARRAIRHELLGHFGLNTFRPAEKLAVLLQILETRAEPSLRHVWERIDKHYHDKAPLIQAEEAFATVAEEERSFLSRGWDTVRSTFQKVLRVTGLTSGPLTLQELRASARAVANGIRAGARVQQTFPASDQAQFRKTIEAQPAESIKAPPTEGFFKGTEDHFTFSNAGETAPSP